jgi:hypothetical protein
MHFLVPFLLGLVVGSGGTLLLSVLAGRREPGWCPPDGRQT